MSIAAAAVTCGVAKLVPSADAVLVRAAARVALLDALRDTSRVSVSGRVERMSSPGAAMSLNCGSRLENAGTPPRRLSALTPSTCGRAAGQLAYGQGCAGDWSELPTAATTSTPFETAYATASASSLRVRVAARIARDRAAR